MVVQKSLHTTGNVLNTLSQKTFVPTCLLTYLLNIIHKTNKTMHA